MNTYENLTLEQHVKRAKMLAGVLHAGQVDKAGGDYYGHLLRVQRYFSDRFMNHLGDLTPQEEYDYNCGIIAALLHDSVEDTPATLLMLRELGFPEYAVRLVHLMTRSKFTKTQYYERIKSDPIAQMLKAADMDDNTDPDRLEQLDETTRERLRAKYAAGYEAIGMTSRWWESST